MLGPFTTASRLTPTHQMSLAVLSRAACASMSTTTPTTTTTRDRGDYCSPMEWAQSFDRAHTISYLTLIETMRLSCTVFELCELLAHSIWGHSGPLCHALSLSLSSLSWTSMRRRRATVAACDSSDTW